MAMQIITADYEGVSVEFDRTGWFNATKVAKRYAKRPAAWLRLPSTAEYIKTLREVVYRGAEITLLKVERGGRGGRDVTWMHPKLAVEFARWLDTRFAIWCNDVVDRILSGDVSARRKPASERSTTSDREPVYSVVGALVGRKLVSPPAAYRALNDYAGVPHLRDMTCGQVVDATEFGRRILHGATRMDDFTRMDEHARSLRGTPAQRKLFGDDDVSGGDA